MSSKLQQSVVRLLGATVSVMSVFGSVAAAGIPAGYTEQSYVSNWAKDIGAPGYLDTGYTPTGTDFVVVQPVTRTFFRTVLAPFA